MPRSCLGLNWFQILATGAITAELSSGCELVVGELPQAVDSIGSIDSGTSNGAGGSGGVAFSDTGGSRNGHPAGGGAESGGSPQGANGGSPAAGGQAATGGDSARGGQTASGGANAGGQVAAGGANAGGGVTTGGAPNAGGQTGSGGGGSCKNPPCDCDGDGGISVACSGGDDCDDTDPLVYKDEPVYYGSPSLHHGYDYDCSSTLDIEPAINVRQDCNVTNLLDCKTAPSQGFLQSIPACGDSGDWGTCIKNLGLTCAPQKQGTQQVLCK